MENIINNMDHIWVLTCAFLVFLMQLGFSMIETGTVRSKNTINVAMKKSYRYHLRDYIFLAGRLRYHVRGWTVTAS